MLKNSLIFGSLLSLALLIYLFKGLDWSAFWQTWLPIKITYVLLSALILWILLWLRSWRWLIISQIKQTAILPVWQALNIGYLGNLIYPARAGEVMRVFAFAHFTKTPIIHSLSSSILDRLLDMFMASAVLLAVLAIHGSAQFGETVLYSAQGLFIFICSSLIILLVWLPQWLNWIQHWQIKSTSDWQQRGQKALIQALTSLIPLRQIKQLIALLLLNIIVFAFDYWVLWSLFYAFGWDLPYMAAITTGVFMMLGSSLPSAPGYIGVYQIAAVLGLGLYQIAEAQALAFSIVYQLMIFSVVGIQGTIIIFYKGFNFKNTPLDH